MEALPLKLPGDWGAKVTLKVVLCPGANVTGVVKPEIVKPFPDTESWEMVALEPPVFCTASVWVLLLPTCTPVKDKLAGVAARAAGSTPVPERAKSSVVLDPLIARDKIPLAEPAAVG